MLPLISGIGPEHLKYYFYVLFFLSAELHVFEEYQQFKDYWSDYETLHTCSPVNLHNLQTLWRFIERKATVCTKQKFGLLFSSHAVRFNFPITWYIKHICTHVHTVNIHTVKLGYFDQSWFLWKVLLSVQDNCVPLLNFQFWSSVDSLIFVIITTFKLKKMHFHCQNVQYSSVNRS